MISIFSVFKIFQFSSNLRILDPYVLCVSIGLSVVVVVDEYRTDGKTGGTGGSESLSLPSLTLLCNLSLALLALAALRDLLESYISSANEDAEANSFIVGSFSCCLAREPLLL